MKKDRLLHFKNTIEKISNKVRFNKTGEETMQSLYLDDLQNEMKSDMISKLEVQKQRYNEFSVNRRTALLDHL
jgi:hypothetical protein